MSTSRLTTSAGRLSLFRRSLLRWYAGARRDLPWRVAAGYPPPYHVLLSEFMLQQTQVATVRPYFQRFLHRFPTLAALAAADPHEVLRLWQGLGYYSRARNLQAAAKVICERHAGMVPRDVAALMQLPGIGRYTAGAIASLSYGTPVAILDGNVQRVLCRLEAIQEDPRRPAIAAKLWETAAALLPARRAADFNSALMELGALVCTPKSPACEACPLRRHCRAEARGLAQQIPPPRPSRVSPLKKRWVLCVQHRGKWLLERRPDKGRWAGLWQFPTRPADDLSPTPRWARQALGLEVRQIRPLGEISHRLTHRRYQFAVFAARLLRRDLEASQVWAAASQLRDFAFSKPQLRILTLLPPSVN